jgi:hypothetical protein
MTVCYLCHYSKEFQIGGLEEIDRNKMCSNLQSPVNAIFYASMTYAKTYLRLHLLFDCHGCQGKLQRRLCPSFPIAHPMFSTISPGFYV